MDWFPWLNNQAATTNNEDAGEGAMELPSQQQDINGEGEGISPPVAVEQSRTVSKDAENAPAQSSSLSSRTTESRASSSRTQSRDAAVLFPKFKSHAHQHSNSGEDDDFDDEKPSKCYEVLLRHPLCFFCLRRFPRSCAVFIGVIVPIFSLIFVSMGFGAKLSEYEAPGEISSNDQILANIFFATRSASRVTNLTKILPRVCLVLWMNNTSVNDLNTAVTNSLEGLVDNTTWKGLEPILTPEDTLLVPNLGEEYPDMRPPLFDNKTVDTGAETFFDFMSACGEAAEGVAVEIFAESVETLIQTSVDLTFNWIRCFPGASGGRSFRGGELTAEERSTDGQTEWYQKVWNRDQEQLFAEYYTNLLQSGMSPDEAVPLATQRSAEDASGGSGCDYNAPAAAWFWFTVQTTVGYGNQAPESYQGRALVFTIGFVSIIAFGGILASAGTILSYLYDDFVTRNGFACLAVPLTACVIWGAAYYAWMVFIAYITIVWKKWRLDLSFSWNDAYWFSYISTTTVGLGDYFLEPEGITGADLCYFPVIFLVGFMMLAAFLGKFAEFVYVCMSRKHKSFVQTLLEKRVRWRDTFAKDLDDRVEDQR